MGLWLAVVFIVLSASFILALSLGPLRRAANVRVLRVLAVIQYAAALLLAGARLLGSA